MWQRKRPKPMFGSHAILFTQCYFGSASCPLSIVQPASSFPLQSLGLCEKPGRKEECQAARCSPPGLSNVRGGCVAEQRRWGVWNRGGRTTAGPKFALLFPDLAVIHRDPAKFYFLYTPVLYNNLTTLPSSALRLSKSVTHLNAFWVTLGIEFHFLKPKDAWFC